MIYVFAFFVVMSLHAAINVVSVQYNDGFLPTMRRTLSETPFNPILFITYYYSLLVYC